MAFLCSILLYFPYDSDPASLQMRAIKDELGDNDDDEDDVAALERKMQNAGMPTNIWKHAQRELRYLILSISFSTCVHVVLEVRYPASLCAGA